MMITLRLVAAVTRRIVRPFGHLAGMTILLAGCAGDSAESRERDAQALQALKLLQAAVSTIKVANASADNINALGAGYRTRSAYSQKYVGTTKKFESCSGSVSITAFSGTVRDDGQGQVVSGPVTRSGDPCFNRIDVLFSDIDPQKLDIRAVPKPVSYLLPELIGYSVSVRCRKDRPGCMRGRYANDGWYFTVADEATAENAKTAILALISYNSR